MHSPYKRKVLRLAARSVYVKETGPRICGQSSMFNSVVYQNAAF